MAKKERTFDHEITLISQTIVEDELKNQITKPTKRTILCDLNSVGQREFYDAAVQGLKPEITFVIHPFEYQGETMIKFNKKDYKVLRTYGNDTEELELTCERVGSGG